MDRVRCAQVQRRRWLGQRVIAYDSLPSTNDLAQQLARDGAAEGTVVIADQQTAGRGRLNRRWEAPPGSSLLLSIVFHPSAPFHAHASRFPMACGLGLLEGILKVTGVQGWLKWPNDVVVERASGWGKLAGLLSEVVLSEGEPQALVVGMGVNVNIAPAVLPGLAPNATSLLQVTGSQVNRTVLFEAILDAVEQLVDACRAGTDVLGLWRSKLAWIGQPVSLFTPDGTVQGEMVDVDASGALVLRLPDGQTATFSVGDVSLRPAAT